MSATIINFSAARTARLLAANAAPHRIDHFVAEMASAARERRDLGGEAFWRDVATMLGRAPPRIAG